MIPDNSEKFIDPGKIAQNYRFIKKKQIERKC